ncbi:MAG: hypothetical protein EOP00_26315, partial [Pedobacter sp.]
MKTQQIFNQYFRTKLIIGMGLGILTTSIRYINGYGTSFILVAGFMLFILTTSFFLGLIDFNFYENSSPKIVLKLLEKKPLWDFQEIGFLKQEKKIVGHINDFKIVLAPLPDIQGNNYLTVLIPLQLQDDLDKYFGGFNENFKLKFDGKVFFAEAVLKNYDKSYDYNKLFN